MTVGCRHFVWVPKRLTSQQELVMDFWHCGMWKQVNSCLSNRVSVNFIAHKVSASVQDSATSCCKVSCTVSMLAAHIGAVHSTLFSSDGSRLLTVGQDGYVRVMDTLTGTEVYIKDTGFDLRLVRPWDGSKVRANHCFALTVLNWCDQYSVWQVHSVEWSLHTSRDQYRWAAVSGPAFCSSKEDIPSLHR